MNDLFKKCVIASIYLGLSVKLHGQSEFKISYFDFAGQDVSSLNFKTMETEFWYDDSTYVVTTYDEDYNLMSVSSFSDDETKVLNGVSISYFSNGSKCDSSYYLKNKKEGKSRGWYSNGRRYYEETYNKGNVIKSIYFDSNGIEVEKQLVCSEAYYPGGEKALFSYLAAETLYPKIAKDAGIQGIVYIQFVVLESGFIDRQKIEVLRGVHPALDAEAIRVVKNMPKWKAGKARGKVVNTYYKLPLRFSLR